MFGKIVGAFVEGFCTGFAGETARQASGVRHEPEFPRVLRSLAAEVGLEIEQLEDDGAALLMQAAGGLYGVSVFLREGRALIHVFSNVQFPPRQVPPVVTQFLVRRNNDELTRVSWDLLHGRRHSVYFVKTAIPWPRLNAQTLAAALTEMVPEAMALDRSLAEMGYAS